MLPSPKTDWWKKLENASLVFYSRDGNRVGMRLSETQIITIILLLGIDFESPNESTAYSDETLLKFIRMKGNPFRLELKDEDIAEDKQA